MTLFSHAGLASIDFPPGLIRTDIDDTMYASMYQRPNFLAALRVGQFGGGGIPGTGSGVQLLAHFWPEDRLNARSVTENDGGINNVATSFTVTAADGAVIDIGYVLQDQAQDPSVAELVQVTGITPGSPNATITISRGYLTTTAATHAANAVWLVVATPQIQMSTRGRDMSRAPILKQNMIQTGRKDVVISAHMITLAKYGMVPGIANQMGYQLHQRFLEALVEINRSAIFGIQNPLGTANEYMTMAGILSWLGWAGVTQNSTATTFNAQGATLNDINVVNPVCINIYGQGGEVPDVIVANATNIDKLARVYRDLIAIRQDELVRGYFVDAIRASIGTRPIRLILDNYMPSSVIAFLDLDAIRLVPFPDMFAYLITAPTFEDGDSASFLYNLTMEVRNTGTDTGYRHQIARNFT